MKYAAKLLGDLANIYSTLEETENLVRLKTKEGVTLTELQHLYDKGFKLIHIHPSEYSIQLTMEKPYV